VKIVSLHSVEKSVPPMEGAAGTYKQVPISRQDGAPTFSFRVFTLEPGGHTPYHRHPYEHVNYVIEGKGVVVTENDEESPIEKGDFALVLPNEKHQYRNTSASECMVVICAVPLAFE